MNWKEALAILASLAAVLGFGLTIHDHVEGPDESFTQPTAPPQKIVILARTTFNDSGRVYVESFDGAIIPLNGSIRVVYVA
jgi:hypothetical protein